MIANISELNGAWKQSVRRFGPTVVVKGLPTDAIDYQTDNKDICRKDKVVIEPELWVLKATRPYPEGDKDRVEDKKGPADTQEAVTDVLVAG
jgi:hypothetical protein